MEDFVKKAEREWLEVTNPSVRRYFVGMATCGESAGAGP
jgi:hypothetical protein